ncbi:MAG: hypothetical protein GX781_00350 [Clostridiales bacterium]|nr:hypothetical protein [Clostridiales bacterium]
MDQNRIKELQEQYGENQIRPKYRCPFIDCKSCSTDCMLNIPWPQTTRGRCALELLATYQFDLHPYYAKSKAQKATDETNA